MERGMARSSAGVAEPRSATPKLSLDYLPRNRPDPPWMATPPVHLPGSVPFRWEEAPGRPKREQAAPPLPRPPSAAARSLDLPPRLASQPQAETRTADTPSPTTVLDGPNPAAGQPTSNSFHSLSSGEEEKSCKMGSKREVRGGGIKERVGWSWRRWRKGRRGRSWEAIGAVARSRGVSPSSSSSSPPQPSEVSCYFNSMYDGGCGFGCGEREDDDEMKAWTAGITRSRSVSDVSSQPTSHCWLISKPS